MSQFISDITGEEAGFITSERLKEYYSTFKNLNLIASLTIILWS